LFCGLCSITFTIIKGLTTVFSLLQRFRGKEFYRQVDIENLALMNLPHFRSICQIYMCTGGWGLFICDGGGLSSHSSDRSCCPAAVEWQEHGFVVQAGRRMVYKSMMEAFGRLRIVLTTGLKSPVGEKL
jgi:hypothetical protein